MERGPRDDGKDTKANNKSISTLYKKSIVTLPGRHSRNSSIRSYKRRTSREHGHSCDGDKVKRDLSVESDIYKLRNNIRYRTINYSGSAKSLSADEDHSFVTETDTRNNRHHKVVSLIVDNFRSLLNKWIHEYLIDSSDNLQKIEDIRDSLLGNIDKRLNRSSRYTLRHSRNSLQNMINDNILKYETSSNYTVPLQNEHYNMISSLSLPRNMDGRANTRRNTCHPLARQKDDFTDSTVILVRLSSQSFTKRCVTYNQTEKNIGQKTSFVNFQVKNALYREAADQELFLNTSYQNEETTSLVRNIYDTHIRGQIENTNDKETITDHSEEVHWCSSHGFRYERNYKRKHFRRPQRLKKCPSFNNNFKSKQFTYLYRKAGKRNPRCHEFLNHFQTILNYFGNYEQQNNIILDVHVNVLPFENPISNKNKTCQHQFNISMINEERDCRYLDTLMESRESDSSSKECKSAENENRPEIISVLDSSESKSKYITESESNCKEVNIEDQRWFDNAKTLTSDKSENILCQIESLKNVIKDLTLVAEKLITEHSREGITVTSKSTQMGPSQCNVAVDAIPQNLQSAFTPNQSVQSRLNSDNKSYDMWYSQNPMIYDTKQITITEQENLKTSVISSDLTATPHPTSICYDIRDSLKDLIPEYQQTKQSKPSPNESKGIQFSCNMASNNTGLKLQTQLKNTNPFIEKKPSFCYIESESLIKVTDMTSKPEIQIHEMIKDVGLTCSLPNPPVNFEEADAKVGRSSVSVKLYNCGDGFNKPQEYVSNTHIPCCQWNNRLCQSEGQMQHVYLHQETCDMSDQNNQGDIKLSRRSRWLKIGKICLFCILFCILIMGVSMVIMYKKQYIKQVWFKSINKIWKSEATSSTTSSDLNLLLTEFGF